MVLKNTINVGHPSCEGSKNHTTHEWVHLYRTRASTRHLLLSVLVCTIFSFSAPRLLSCVRGRKRLRTSCFVPTAHGVRLFVLYEIFPRWRCSSIRKSPELFSQEELNISLEKTVSGAFVRTIPPSFYVLVLKQHNVLVQILA